MPELLSCFIPNYKFLEHQRNAFWNYKFERVATPEPDIRLTMPRLYFKYAKPRSPDPIIKERVTKELSISTENVDTPLSASKIKDVRFKLPE